MVECSWLIVWLGVIFALLSFEWSKVTQKKEEELKNHNGVYYASYQALKKALHFVLDKWYREEFAFISISTTMFFP